MIDHSMATTGFEFQSFIIRKHLGLVRGITLRARSIVGDASAQLEQCEKTRQDAFRMMLEHAGKLGANAIIGMRYDTSEITQGLTEIVAYGTAVVVEPEK
jgi:uncharacterized protein YbjQ (UPF0145 family)